MMLKRLYILLVFVLLISVSETWATTKPTNRLIVSGQIINIKYGSPVIGHKVFITIPDVKSGGSGYYKEIFTDSAGVYLDTINTTLAKGSLKVYTLDKDLSKVDSVVNFRFFRNTRMVLLVNLEIEMPFHTHALNPRFKYVQKQEGNKFYFHFIDLTFNNYIVSRKWSFGDGTFSDDINPDHTYKSPGIYRVKLTVQATLSGVISINSFSKMILIPDETFFHIGGQVFIDYFPIDIGNAFLYFKDSTDSFIPVDTVMFDTLGYYIFYNLPKGEYLIKAQPCANSAFYGEKCPTYYGDVLKWQNAESCQVTETCWDYDIHLLGGISDVVGNGSIKGNIFIVDDSLKQFGLLTGENITIFLFDDEESNFTYIYTNKKGAFDFKSLEMGKYKLYPEVTGINNAMFPVELDENNPTIDSVVIEVSMEGVTGILPFNRRNPEMIQGVYPNPATVGDKVVISLNLKTSQQIGCSVFDIMGNLVYHAQPFLTAGDNKLTLLSNNLSNGLYVVSIQTQQGIVATRKLVVNK